jgi:hypothetical protein
MTLTYTKLFSSITESTIWQEPAATRIVWITMLAMCDRLGRVHASIPGLASRAKVTLAEAEDALVRFMAPDKYSRTKDHEGRRISEIDGGWLLLNHAKYRDMRDEESRREYNAEWMRRKRQESKKSCGENSGDEKSTVDNVDSGGSLLAHAYTDTDADTDADADLKERGANAPLSTNLADKCPHAEIVALYHQILPELTHVRSWEADRQKLLRARWREDVKQQDIAWWERFFNYVRGCPLLMGEVPAREGDGHAPWRSDLEWLIRPKNCRKVLERKYEPRDFHDARASPHKLSAVERVEAAVAQRRRARGEVAPIEGEAICE